MYPQNGIPLQDRPRFSKAVVVIILFSEENILCIKDRNREGIQYWKLPAESVEPGEPELNALWGGLREEAGIDFKVIRLPNGDIEAIQDERIKKIERLLPSEVIGPKHNQHTRHVWGVMVSPDLILSLSEKHPVGDSDENIITQAFQFEEIKNMRDFLPQHRDILQRLMQRPTR